MVDPSSGVLLFGARLGLVAAHAIASALLVVTSTIHLVLAVRALRRGAIASPARVVRVSSIVAIAYPIVFVLGALLYPTYRVHVRGLFLDAHAPRIAELFDGKEVVAALALPIAPALPWIARGLVCSNAELDRDRLRAFVALSAVVCASVWLAAIAGLVVASVRSVV